ncbi:MAG: tetratricopeptide repeat protein [Planctomycetes bacterium]|nr:tetratricopeptide repeat protein [Planctomycetota bacterium]
MSERNDYRMTWTRRAVLAVFLLSGAAGLMHEVAWTRLLRLVMGNTTYSIATVLCVFMAGLAAGSYLGGRIIDRRRDPLRVFALIEGVVGIYCLMLPWLIHAVGPIYRAAYAVTYGSQTGLTIVRFLLCTAILIVPATMMGATLPVLTRWFVRSVDQTGRSAGRLYAFNTLGAVVGTALAGMWLIPAVGLWRTICVAAAVNLLICAAGLFMHARLGAVDEPPPADELEAGSASTTDAADRLSRRAVTVLLIGYALSGLAAMLYEVAWTRVLTLMIGSSVYGFSLILMAFVLGLALGSMICARFVDRVRHPMRVLAAIQMAIGGTSLLVVPLLGTLPFFVTGMISELGRSFWVLQAAEWGLVLSVMLAPTLLMGAAFPLVTRTYAQWSNAVGRSVGAVYGSNTIGTIIGSFLGGFMLIPWLGIQYTIFAAVSLSVLIGCAYLLASSAAAARRRLMVSGLTAAGFLLAMTVIPRWDAAKMSFGPFVQAVWLDANAARSHAALQKIVSSEQTIFYHEGLTSTVAVNRDASGVLSLLTNGRVEAKSRGGEAQQRLLAHIPLLLHPDPRDVLEIGLASGVTLDAAARHDVRSLDCVELSESVIDATRLFEDVNRHVLDDPRLRLIITDGRNYLSLTDRKYDIIISQPSDPATAGVADLFTREFFQNCYDRLNDRGMMCVWLKASSVDKDVFRSVVQSFGRTFDDMTIWSATGFTEFMLVGSRGPMRVDESLLAGRIADPRLAADMKILHIESVADLLGNLVTERDGAMRFAGEAPMHTDDNALLEFSAPRTEFTRKDPRDLVHALLDARTTDMAFLTDDQAGEAKLAEIKARSRRYIEARILTHGVTLAFERNQLDRAMDMLRQAAALNPHDPWIMVAVARLRQATTKMVEAGRMREAIAFNAQIVKVLTDSAIDHFNLASLLRDAGANEQAAAEYAQVLRIEPDHVLAHHNLAKLLAKLGRVDEAVRHYRRAIALDKTLDQALNNLAWILATAGKPELGTPAEAVTMAERACELTGQRNAAYLDTLAEAHEAAGQIDAALRVALRAYDLARGSGQSELAAELHARIARYERSKATAP